MPTTPHPFPPAPAAPADRRSRRGGRTPRTRAPYARAATVQVALLTLLTALTLELVRASGPLLDRAFSAGVVSAAVTALVTYALPGLVAAALVVVARRGSRSEPGPTGRAPDVLLGSVTPIGVGVLAVVRVAVQALDGGARVVAGLVGVAAAIAVLVLACAAVLRRPASGGGTGGLLAATGVTIGVGLQVALQSALGTWDAVWRRDVVGWGVTVVLVGAAVALALLAATAARQVEPDPAAPDAAGRPARLWALGPFLSLAAMALGNHAFATSQAAQADLTVLWLLLGIAAAAVVALVPRAADALLRRAWVPALLLPVAVGGVFWGAQPLRVVSLLVALASAPVVLATALRSPRPTGDAVAVDAARATSRPDADHGSAPAPPVGRTALTASVTGLAVILPLLAYQLDYDVPLGFPNALVMVAAAAALGVAGGVHRSPEAAERLPASSRDVVGPVAALVVLVWAVPGLVAPDATPRAAERAPGTSLRLLSWNLHYGVSGDPAVELEEVARVIEASEADVVALQEVSRGWVMGGGAEMATWLSERLGMPYVFAPAADRQFGNAILSRYALDDVVAQRLPYGDGPQWRSAVSATVELDDGSPVRLTSVHLQHRDSNTPTRLEQLDVLLRASAAAGPRAVDVPAVVAGDYNAEPGWPEIARMQDAGFESAVDVAGDPGALTFPSRAPDRRIDWVFTRGLEPADVEVLDVPFSDHLPILATLRAAR
ncbi:endonuclease/exonuclease/phosphatase family protein [Cellulomonas fimi]|uniref:Endonuclease n=1 Tax=Cellulomonas fimi TaxID=1708 RepID=A0A7Y0LX76_CELFI|nr:endonuclease/exonuclease/phosphatase family protein [Cellulomonas fimi]NMR19917.1 endonuclease [Cellulomonas fimi]